MDSNRKRIIFDGATTLLLVVAATATLVCCVGPDLTIDSSSTNDLPNWMICERMGKSDLPPGDNCPENNEDMLERLKEEINIEKMKQMDPSYKVDERKKNSLFIKKILVNFGTLDLFRPCLKLQMSEFFVITTMCDDEIRFRRYAEFVDHYARIKYRVCSLELIKGFTKENELLESILSTLGEFFTVAMGIENTQTHYEKLLGRLQSLDLVTDELNVNGMLKVANKYLKVAGPSITNDAHEKCKPCKAMAHGRLKQKEIDKRINNIMLFLTKQFERCKLARDKAKVIDMARAIGAIKENELTPRFILINEYLNIFTQLSNENVRTGIKKNLEKNYM